MWTAAFFNLRKQDSETAVVSSLLFLIKSSSGPVKPVLLFFLLLSEEVDEGKKCMNQSFNGLDDSGLHCKCCLVFLSHGA